MGEQEPQQNGFHLDAPMSPPYDDLTPPGDNGLTTVDLMDTDSPPDYAQLRSQGEKTHSPVFELGGYRWRLLLFPSGNRTRDTVSVFLESLDASEQPQDSDWHVCARFAVALINPRDESRIVHQDAQHRFDSQSVDWGFSVMTTIAKLYRGSEEMPAIIDREELNIVVWVRIYHDDLGVLWHKFDRWDSRKETGFVGLKNQGATCYMNSVLQSLYFTNYFRKATFQIPSENEDPQKSIVLALQRIFYNLQASPDAVGTTELTKSFGWDALDSFAQHDVQEFNRVLQDNLESKMKGTKAEGAISRLFVGKMKSFITCINVPYESSRMEDFYDIQLNVKGCKNLIESFNDYVAVETLDGDNKYQAEGYGLQDAKKGVIFTALPPVLHLQLKRFEYDFQRDAMVKINDRHEYPTEIELDGYLDPSVPQTVSQKYHLHGVLVHSGDLHGGHYQAFLRPGLDEKWYKFDDDRVTPASKREVFDENFGGEFQSANRQGLKLKRFTNAYMLVYIRDGDRPTVLAPVTPEDIPLHLQKRLTEEKINAERERKEQEEAYLYVTVRIIQDEDVATHHGFDLFNFNYPAGVNAQKVLRTQKLGQFKADLCHQLGLQPEEFRVWNMVARQNKTLRPDAINTVDSNEWTMEQALNKMGKSNNEIRFYIESIKGRPLHWYSSSGNYPPPDQPKISPIRNKEPGSGTDKGLTLWLKEYDPVTANLHYIGRLYVDDKDTKIGEIIPTLVEAAGLAPSTPIKVYEEVKPEMIDTLKLKLTFHTAEIGDGDILVIQRELTPEETEAIQDPSLKDALDYYTRMKNRVTMSFRLRGRERDDSEALQIVLSRRTTYPEIQEIIAQRTGAESEKIRLLSVIPHNGAPNWILDMGFGPKGVPVLEAIHPGLDAGIVVYEVLGVQVKELENKRFMKVWWVDKKNREQGPFDFLLPKTGKVADIGVQVAEKIHDGTITVDEDAANQVSLQPPRYRIYEIARDGRLLKLYNDTDHIDTIRDSTDIYVEVSVDGLPEILADEINAHPIQVFHFTKELSRGFGIPLWLPIIPAEPFSATRERLQARLGMNEKDFAKAKFVLVNARGTTRADEALIDVFTSVADDLLSELPRNEEWSLGVDHLDRSGRARLGSFEKAIKIFVSRFLSSPPLPARVSNPTMRPNSVHIAMPKPNPSGGYLSLTRPAPRNEANPVKVAFLLASLLVLILFAHCQWGTGAGQSSGYVLQEVDDEVLEVEDYVGRAEKILRKVPLVDG
ncbi:ubiquitin carboxyl-terminal hydrolase 5 [Fimicolochytrium jonesii]|uniref:ubiquitin carboxyl-terminal hydrolase 5 n=1 Tax=Fimicolochytrium jonesii TaxID=1396493 RepID=UPI0022FDB379|nr:ubiquitin carboxyl-terminal hydrolase 5 [Fimicolochytrium jonesii]KAI8821452.1 ubiquitin carboxyl-terminal hydrolase 5 [Fimicolochytrium jonesii]